MSSYCGKFVRVAFNGKNKNGLNATEHLWLKVQAVHYEYVDTDTGDRLICCVENEPVLEYDPPLMFGSQVQCLAKQVEDILEN
jgi:hypothetical protein